MKRMLMLGLLALAISAPVMAWDDDDHGSPGQQGPPGPQGPQGPAGAPGAPGPAIGGFMVAFLPQDLPMAVTAGSLASPVPMGHFQLQAGNYAITGSVDLAPVVLNWQKYVCRMDAAGIADPIDITQVTYAVQTRLILHAVVHLDFQARVTLSCGADMAASMNKAKFSVVELDRVDLPLQIVAGN